MGVFGTAIFSDDTACDVRDDYTDLIGDGLSGAEATTRLLKQYSSSINDPDERCPFWLSLAATQWKLGRLEPFVLEQALHIVDSGEDLSRWAEAPAAEQRKRRAALEKLRAQLTSPQKPPKRVSKRFRATCEWQVGELFSYRLLSGRLVVFCVIALSSDKGGTWPTCELLDWVGDEVPSPDVLRNLPIRTSVGVHRINKLGIGAARKTERPDDRLQSLGLSSEPNQTGSFTSTVTLWRWLDEVLKRDFGLD